MYRKSVSGKRNRKMFKHSAKKIHKKNITGNKGRGGIKL